MICDQCSHNDHSLHAIVPPSESCQGGNDDEVCDCIVNVLVRPAKYSMEEIYRMWKAGTIAEDQAKKMLSEI